MRDVSHAALCSLALLSIPANKRLLIRKRGESGYTGAGGEVAQEALSRANNRVRHHGRFVWRRGAYCRGS